MGCVDVNTRLKIGEALAGNIVPERENVKEVLTKGQLSRADAGMVRTSDMASDFITHLLGPDGQTTPRSFGFEPAPAG